MSRRNDSLVIQNAIAAASLSLVTALVLAVLTKVLAPIFGLSSVIAISDLIVMSVIGSLLSFIVLIAVTLALAARSAERGWELDDVNAPLVSAVGDVVTLPALLVASLLLEMSNFTVVLSAIVIVATLVSLGWVRQSRLNLVRLILWESLPILLATGIV